MNIPTDMDHFEEGDDEQLFFDTPEQNVPENYFDDMDGDGNSDDRATHFEDISESLSDIDFSEFKGDFRSSMRQINKKLDKKGTKKGQRVLRKKGGKKPLSKRFGVKKSGNIVGGKKQMGKIIVPQNRKVIVEGVSKFILSNTGEANSTKNIGYYKGKKLNALVFTINNQGALPFTVDLFNPSNPLDYLYSTGLNLNDKIEVSGLSSTSYSDVLFNLLANPTLIVNAKFVVAGPLVNDQVNQSLIFKNKNIEGKEKVNPYNMFLQKDTSQFQNNVIFFDIMGGLNRPFIPDGMDVIGYTVLPGMSVTFGFFYKQVSLKKFFFAEARNYKGLL